MTTSTPIAIEHVPRGTRIPRLQELSFLPITMLGVADGAGFEEIRQRLVSHMIELRENSPGTGNTALFRTARGDPKRYVSNVSSSLKELMLLRLVEKATVPSSARAALNYANTTFAASEKGLEWAALLRADLRKGYDRLLNMLWHAHPQFRSFLRGLSEDGIAVPLLQWGELPEPRTRGRYVSYLSTRVSMHLADEPCGWVASEAEVLAAVKGYLDDRYREARARGREEPYPRNQDFVNACEEALVKFAFARRGLAIDYISHQILRRWTKVLGVANFSYHVPRWNALRLWSTAAIDESGEDVSATRRIGPAVIQSAVEHLPSVYDEVRRRDPTRSLWVPIYRVRAGICWKLNTIEATFDNALRRILDNEAGQDIPFGVNLDKAQYGSFPPSELPLRLRTRRGVQTYYAMSLVPKRQVETNA
ncbi:MAG: hypothetical protein OXD31_16205 [Chloroflexi bacterium]|nr:hypothetical protein [Chloroflexota bacterium]